MAVTYTTAVKNARLDAVAAQIDGGSGAGKLKIRDSGNVVLAVITLADPCAAAASGGVLTFSGFPRTDSSADATGTAANAIITDSADTTCISGLTVGTSGSDINLDTTSITAAQVVTINSATITHA